VQIFGSTLTQEQIGIVFNTNAAVNFGTGYDEAEQLEDGAASSPIGYWPMDENTGTSTTYDKSGNGNDGSMNGSMTEDDWIPGKFGSTLDFDGSNDFIDLGTSGTLYPSTNMTVSIWVNFSSNQDSYLVSKLYDGNNKYFDLSTNTGTTYTTIEFRVYEQSGIYCSTTHSSGDTAEIPNNQWHHIVGVFDASDSISIYVDGVLSNTNTTSIPSGTCSNGNVGNANVYIADSEAFSGPVDGAIDDVKIYDTVLTPAQIAYEYNRGKPLGWWRLDECQGSTAYDASGNGNDGTITIGGTGDNTSEGTCSSGTGTEAWNNGTTGKRNASLDFDGTDDYVQTADSNEFSFGDGSTTDQPFSVSTWVNMDDATWFEIIHKDTDSGSIAAEWSLFTDGSDNLFFEMYDNGFTNFIGQSTNSTLTTKQNNWTHIVGTYDGSGSSSGIDIYINGILQASSSETGGSYAAMHPLSSDVHIGAYLESGSESYANGQIDDVRIYNYALSQNQVKKIMNHGTARFD
jgi:hypothetical protein